MNEDLKYKQVDTKNFFISFLNKNKKIFFFLFLIISFVFVGFFLLKQSKEREEILLSEKYIKAGILFSNGKTIDAKNYYEELILSKNKAYSLLSLNNIIEKNLIENEERIIELFDILEKSNFNQNYLDLVYLKKALYLMKIQNQQKANNLLKRLIEQNSNLKFIAQELLKN